MSQPKSRVSRTTDRNGPKAPAPAEDDNVCIICAEPIRYAAVLPCNNVTCHLCSFRQRALYGKKTCLVCRTEHDDVIFTEQHPGLEARYSAFVAQSRNIESAKYGLHFTAQYVKDDTLKLAQMACAECGEEFAKFERLSEHTRAAHNKQYCDICGAHKKAFVCELTLYTAKQLQRHITDGDREGFTGHPRCRFCKNKRFYSDDELALHVRDRHERCYLCDLDNHDNTNYYRNYDDLYDHFRTSHYVCSVPLCVEKRFVVFREDLDLTAHMLKEHGGLTGLAGRVVIGAQFQLLLSTVPLRSKPRAQADTLDTKRRRLEERAKHYLHNHPEHMAKFTKANQSFRSRRISATDLLREYEALFSDCQRSEIALLVYDLAELFPETSDQRMLLQRAYDNMSPAAGPAMNFPVLGNSLGQHISNLSWGAGAGGRRTADDMFPVLSKPKASKKPVVANGPIRYTVIKKPTKPVAPKPQVNAYKENTSYRPSYLDVPEASSAPPLPVLGSGSSSRVHSRPLLRSQSPAAFASAPSSSVNLPESKFPTLEKKERKVIPPVKPIVTGTGQWGLGLVLTGPKATEEWGIPIVDKRAEKLKRKSEKQKRK